MVSFTKQFHLGKHNNDTRHFTVSLQEKAFFLSFVNNQKEHTRNPNGSGSTVIKCIKTPIVHLTKLHFLLILNKTHVGVGGGERSSPFTWPPPFSLSCLVLLHRCPYQPRPSPRS